MSRGRFGDVRRFETIDSTNAYLLEAARAGAPEGVVAVADYQTAGRGRRGRRWAAPPGANLLVSVLLRPALPAELRPIAAGVVALAARDAVQRTCGVELGVKWPNDLVTAEGGKVAGVLAETDAGTGAGGGEAGGRGAGGRGAGGGAGGGLEPAVVVGIGLNCNWPGLGQPAPGPGSRPGEPAGPEEASSPAEDPGLAQAVSLAQLCGRPVDREAVLAAFLERLEARVADLDDPGGPARHRAELRAACTTLGTEVRVELADRTVEGAAVDLTGEGHLVVRTPRGIETIVTGDVVHLRPARPGLRPPGAPAAGTSEGQG